jgi:salicylate hydroxylase
MGVNFLSSSFVIPYLIFSRQADDIMVSRLFYRKPISSWTKGKVVLIGDAAHPMLPRNYFTF